MRPSTALCCVSALSLEGAALAPLVAGPPTLRVALLSAALHVSGTLCAAFALERAVPPRLRPEGRRPAGFAFLAIVSLFLPAIGMLGLGLALRWGLARADAPQSLPPWRTASLGALPELAPGAPQGAPRMRSTAGVLRGSRDLESRMRAVEASRHLPGPAAARLLSTALDDPADDVRLLAHALRQGREQAVEDRMARAALALAEAASSDKPSWHARLAEAQWELVEAELVQGDARAHVLAGARAHAERALEGGARAETELLRGSILLAQGELGAARLAFEQASSRGVAPEFVAPKLAEIAFRERRFDAIAPLLSAAAAPGYWR